MHQPDTAPQPNPRDHETPPASEAALTEGLFDAGAKGKADQTPS